MLSEVVVQGVRRFGEVRRFTLNPGYNVIYGLTESGKSTLYDVLRSLLFAETPDREKTFTSWRQDVANVCRAGLTVTAGAQVFRVMKDYISGHTTLSKLDPAQQKYVLMLDQSADIQRWLREALRVPAGPEFDQLFTMSSGEVPSHNMASGGSRPRAGEQFEAQVRGMSLAQKKEALGQIVKDYQSQATLSSSENQQMELSGRADELERTIAQADKLESAVRDAEFSFESYALKPKLPDDIADKIADYERQVRERDDALARLEPDLNHARSDLQAAPPEPWKEPLGIVGAVLVVAGMIGMAALAPPARYAAMLALFGGFGLVGWRVFVWLSSGEQHKEITATVNRSGDQIRALEKAFDVETAIVRSLMKQVGVANTDDLLVYHEERKNHEERLDATRMALDNFKSGQDVDGIRSEHNQIRAKLDELEAAIAQAGGALLAGTDPQTIVARAYLLETEVARAEARPPQLPSTLVGNPALDDDKFAASTGDPAQTVINEYCAARNADKATVLRSIHEVFSRNVAAFTGGVWKRGVFHATGSVSVRRSGGQEPVALETLQPHEQDAVYAALRYSLFQLESKGRPPIVILDDPFDFDEGRQQMVGRALHSLGRAGQVLHFTSSPSLKHLADHSVEL